MLPFSSLILFFSLCDFSLDEGKELLLVLYNLPWDANSLGQDNLLAGYLQCRWWVG